MKWGSMWTITVNPKVEDTTGKVGITITFDDSTNDKPINIGSLPIGSNSY